MESAPRAFYQRLAPHVFRATAATTGPWDDNLQHGGPPSALFAAVIDAQHARKDVRIAKLTVDFLGAIPKGDLSVATEVLRPGKRIELVQAVLSHAGRDVACARAWRISFTDGRAADKPGTPPPPVPPAQPQEFFAGLEKVGYGQAIEWRFVSGGFNRLGAAAAWTKVRLPLIEGEAIGGLQRLLVVADAANGLSAELPIDRYLFVPPSLTVTIARQPEGEWMFVDAKTSISQDGIGMTHALLSDARGFIGTAAQCLFVSAR